MHRIPPFPDRPGSLHSTNPEGGLAADPAETDRGPLVFVPRIVGRVPGAVVPGIFVGLALLAALGALLGAWIAATTVGGLLVLGPPVLAMLLVWRYRIRSSLGTVESGDADPDPAVRELAGEPFRSVDDAAERLGALERLFRERGDRRAVFLTVYARVTREVATEIKAGGFENPAWVADYLVTFANLYREALITVETGEVESLPGAWRLYFRTTRTQDSLVLQQAVLGINAHVNYDLALALRAVGVDGDRATKYRDHRRINDILARLATDTPEQLGRAYAPGLPRLVDVAGPLGRRVWVCALAVGREVAWWAAVAHTSCRFEPVNRALGGWMNLVSTGLAYLVLVPNGASVALHVLGAIEGSPSVQRPVTTS